MRKFQVYSVATAMVVAVCCPPCLVVAHANELNPKAAALNVAPADAPDLNSLSERLAEYHGSREAYLAAILQIENENGVYDRRLTDQLLGLGLVDKGQGEHTRALDSFARALHLSRINDGLNSLSQAPILELMIESYIATQDWANVHDKQQYLYVLRSRNYDIGDPRLIEPLTKMMNWYLESYYDNDQPEAIGYLNEAKSLNHQIIDLIEVNFGEDDERLEEALVQLAETNYELFVARAELDNDAVGHRNNPYLINDRSVIRHKSRDVSRGSIPIGDPYSEGREALQKRYSIIDPEDPRSKSRRMRALVRLGDWYLIFNKKESALGAYREAQDIASEGGEVSLLAAELFDRPHLLRFQHFEKEEPDPTKQNGYVKVTFNVTDTGRVRDLKVIESEPAEMMDSEVASSVRDARFRPRIVDGKPVDTEGVSLRHTFQFLPK